MSDSGLEYETRSRDESSSTQRMMFFDDEASTRKSPPASSPAEPERPERRSRGFLRHFGSFVLALALTPIALVLVDYGMLRRREALSLASVDVDARAVLVLAGAAVLLFLVVALGRMSPLGPLVAGLVWGLGPWVAVVFFLERTTDELQRVPEVYDGIAVSAPDYGFAVYAVVAALLIGTGFAAPWRRRR